MSKKNDGSNCGDFKDNKTGVMKQTSYKKQVLYTLFYSVS